MESKINKYIQLTYKSFNVLGVATLVFSMFLNLLLFISLYDVAKRFKTTVKSDINCNNNRK